MNEMTTISQTTFSTYFPEWTCQNFDQNFTEVVPKGSIDNMAALARVMVWRRTGDDPLPEPMLSQFTDIYMRH